MKLVCKNNKGSNSHDYVSHVYPRQTLTLLPSLVLLYVYHAQLLQQFEPGFTKHGTMCGIIFVFIF